jgi:hypothetical protein
VTNNGKFHMNSEYRAGRMSSTVLMCFPGMTTNPMNRCWSTCQHKGIFSRRRPSRNSSVPASTMLQSRSTHLNHPSKLRESVIVTRRRWLSHLYIRACPSSFVNGSALCARSTSLDIPILRRDVVGLFPGMAYLKIRKSECI